MQIEIRLQSFQHAYIFKSTDKPNKTFNEFKREKFRCLPWQTLLFLSSLLEGQYRCSCMVPLEVLFMLPWFAEVLMICPHATVKHLCLVFEMICCHSNS